MVGRLGVVINTSSDRVQISVRKQSIICSATIRQVFSWG